MTIIETLEAVKAFLDEQVAQKINLENPLYHELGEPNLRYVNPGVYLGYLPPGDMLPEGYAIPGLIIGLEEDADDGDGDAGVRIRITFAVYRAGGLDEADELVPDMTGYRDLLTLIQKTKSAVLSARHIGTEGGPKTLVQPPVKSGMYKEQPWPYWYGYMTFEVSVPSIDAIDLEL